MQYTAETTHKETDGGVLKLISSGYFFYVRTEQGTFIKLNARIRGEMP
jgi:hypothetical protein